MPPLSSFDTFYAVGANQHILSAVQAFCQDTLSERQLFLWGDANVGKTHLLSAACQYMSNAGFHVAYLNGDMASAPGALDALENMDLVCFDDIHLLAALAEEPLFHMINRCRETDTRLLLASRHAVDGLPITLADLRTRLSWGPVFGLQGVAAEHIPALFEQLLAQRSLPVSDEVTEFVMRRYPRDVTALKSLVEKLDEASMSTKRGITIPLVQEIFKRSDELTV